MLQIVASLIDAARGVIYDLHMFIVQATDLSSGSVSNDKNEILNCCIVFVNLNVKVMSSTSNVSRCRIFSHVRPVANIMNFLRP